MVCLSKWLVPSSAPCPLLMFEADELLILLVSIVTRVSVGFDGDLASLHLSVMSSNTIHYLMTVKNESHFSVSKCCQNHRVTDLCVCVCVCVCVWCACLSDQMENHTHQHTQNQQSLRKKNIPKLQNRQDTKHCISQCVQKVQNQQYSHVKSVFHVT